MDMQFKVLPAHTFDWQRCINDFNRVKSNLFGNVGRREMYLWNWVYTAADVTTITVNNQVEVDKEFLNTIKTLGVMWDVLVDDIADDMEIKQAKSLLPLAMSTRKDYSKLSQPEREYLEFSDYIIETVYSLSRQLPGFERHCQSLNNQYEKLKENFLYSLTLRNDYHTISLKQFVNILSNNMHMVINGIIDLMGADYPTTLEDSPSVHATFWCGQRMGRIGNSVTTYEYEIPRGDYSSEVVAFALNYGFINMENINNREWVLETIKACEIEALLWHLWNNYRSKLTLLTEETTNLNVPDYIAGLTQLRKLHQESRGKK